MAYIDTFASHQVADWSCLTNQIEFEGQFYSSIPSLNSQDNAILEGEFLSDNDLSGHPTQGTWMEKVPGFIGDHYYFPASEVVRCNPSLWETND